MHRSVVVLLAAGMLALTADVSADPIVINFDEVESGSEIGDYYWSSLGVSFAPGWIAVAPCWDGKACAEIEFGSSGLVNVRRDWTHVSLYFLGGLTVRFFAEEGGHGEPFKVWTPVHWGSPEEFEPVGTDVDPFRSAVFESWRIHTLTFSTREEPWDVVPEPASLLLFGAGLLGFRAWGTRRQ